MICVFRIRLKKHNSVIFGPILIMDLPKWPDRSLVLIREPKTWIGHLVRRYSGMYWGMFLARQRNTSTYYVFKTLLPACQTSWFFKTRPKKVITKFFCHVGPIPGCPGVPSGKWPLICRLKPPTCDKLHDFATQDQRNSLQGFLATLKTAQGVQGSWFFLKEFLQKITFWEFFWSSYETPFQNSFKTLFPDNLRELHITIFPEFFLSFSEIALNVSFLSSTENSSRGFMRNFLLVILKEFRPEFFRKFLSKVLQEIPSRVFFICEIKTPENVWKSLEKS